MWRRIADAIRLDIVGGKLARGEKLPGEMRWPSASRSTATRCGGAIAALAEEGVVRAEQGRGTFVDHARRLSYRIGKRTLPRDWLARRAISSAMLLASRLEQCRRQCRGGAAHQAGCQDHPVRDAVAAPTAGPLSRATGWVDYRRFPDLCRAARSDEPFGDGGVSAPTASPIISRATTHISARHADAEGDPAAETGAGRDPARLGGDRCRRGGAADPVCAEPLSPPTRMELIV